MVKVQATMKLFEVTESMNPHSKLVTNPVKWCSTKAVIHTMKPRHFSSIVVRRTPLLCFPLPPILLLLPVVGHHLLIWYKMILDRSSSRLEKQHVLIRIGNWKQFLTSLAHLRSDRVDRPPFSTLEFHTHPWTPYLNIYSPHEHQMPWSVLQCSSWFYVSTHHINSKSTNEFSLAGLSMLGALC